MRTLIGALAVLVLLAAWWLVGTAGVDTAGANPLVGPPDRASERADDPLDGVHPGAVDPLSSVDPPSRSSTEGPVPVGGAAMRLTCVGRLVTLDGQPVGQAAVRVSTGPGASSPRHGVTDVAQHVAGVSGPDGRFSITIELAALEPAVTCVVRAARDALVVEASRTWPAGELVLDTGDLVMRVGGGLTARALDSEGRPLTGAVIEAMRLDAKQGSAAAWTRGSAPASATSGPDGLARLSGLPAGPTRVRCVAASRPVAVRDVEVLPGVDVALGDIVLTLGARISGSVRDPDGRPVAGALVVAMPIVVAMAHGAGIEERDLRLAVWRTRDESTGEPVFEARTDDDGRFALEGLRPEERYAVMAGAEGCEPALRLDVVAGAGEPVHLFLRRGARLLLDVYDAESGHSLPDARVSTLRLSAPGSATTNAQPLTTRRLTDAEGDRPVLASAPAGTMGHLITATAGGHVGRRILLPGVEPGEDRRERIALPRGAVVSGRVQRPDGRPVGGARVVAETQGAGDAIPAETTSAADGAFTLDSVSEGTVVLMAHAPGLPPGEPRIERTDRSKPTAGVVLIVGGSLALEGEVLTATGDPADDHPVHVRARSGRSTELSTRTDEAGLFRFEGLTAGAWTVTAAPGAVTEVLLEDGPLSPVTLRLRARPRVVGRVEGLTADEQGPCWIVAELTGTDPARVTTIVQADASFSVDLPSPGAWALTPRTSSRSGQVTEIMANHDELHRVDLAFARSGLAGLVTDEDTGQGVVGVDITVSPVGDGDRSERLRTTSGGGGRYAFPSLAPGRYRLSVVEGPWVTVLRSYEVEIGAGPSELDVVVTRSSRLVGTVTAPSGWSSEHLVLYLQAQTPGRPSLAPPLRPDAAGRFTIDGLRPGEYDYYLQRDVDRVPPLDDAGALFDRGHVELAPGAVTTLSLVIDPSGG